MLVRVDILVKKGNTFRLIEVKSKSYHSEEYQFAKQEGKKEKAVLFTISSEPFNPPPLSLLEGDRGKPGVGDIKANANIIKRTLQKIQSELATSRALVNGAVNFAY